MVSANEPLQIEDPPIDAENGSSSDSDQDQIEKLKSEARLKTETENGSSNGVHEPEAEEIVLDDDDECPPKLDEEERTEEVVENEEEEKPGEKEEQQEKAEVTMKETSEDVVTLDDDDDIQEVNTTAEEPTTSSSTNGHAKPAEEKMEVEHKNGTENGQGQKRDIECIELNDDDDDIIVQPPAKKVKSDEVKTEAEKIEHQNNENVLAQNRLLDKLDEYVGKALDDPASQNRKLLDTLLGAINAQVQKEPLSVRRLILDKILVLPNTITIPPSQCCDLLIEHDPEVPLTKTINKMFGDERPKLSDTEKRDKQVLKQHNPAPNMTKLLMDIGQDLVQEATYCDIVHAKNLPETPKNVETYKQVAQQLKPVWETLKRKNEPYKLKMNRCGVCGFQTESSLVMSSHKATVHQVGSKYQCAICKETDTNEQRMKEHYFEAHLIIATIEEKEAKYPCVICQEDFNFKGVREQHYKQCKKDYIRLRNIMMPKADDALHINRWFWEKPAIDPAILQQQQNAQIKKQQQQAMAHQQLVQQQAHAAQIRKQQQQQQLMREQGKNLKNQQSYQQLQQLMNMFQNSKGNTAQMSANLLAAMQAHIRRTTGTPAAAATTSQVTAMQQLLQKQMQLNMAKSPANQAAVQAAAAALKKSALMQKHSRMVGSSAAQTAQAVATGTSHNCEICDALQPDKEKYLSHLQQLHKQMIGKTTQDMTQGAPLACSRCRDRFWTYEGLERHLVMSHGLVTADLLQKAQKKEDGGRCKLCGKQYAFNMLQHLVADHQVKLCSAEIMYSCDVCSFKCQSYQILETHLSTNHPKGGDKKAVAPPKKEDCITLDD